MYIMKLYLYNFDPLKPHFYIVKLAFTGVYIFFFIFAPPSTDLRETRITKISGYMIPEKYIRLYHCFEGDTNVHHEIISI